MFDSIAINGVVFTPNPDCKYRHNYIQAEELIASPGKWHDSFGIAKDVTLTELSVRTSVYRDFILNDLWFILCFVLKTPDVNRPFIVKACRAVEDSGDWTIHLWSRGHYKSSIRKARNIQRLLKYPKKCQAIVSHTRPAAKKHLRPIMLELENNAFLKSCFPDVLYANPRSEATKWAEDDGLVVRGHEDSRPESNIEAHGIKEGMPIGVHFDWIDVDDLETPSDVRNPDIVLNGRETVDLCNYLLTESGAMTFWGTPYSHEGIYVPHVVNKKKADGTPKYKYVRFPATHDGTRTGKPVLWTQEKFNDMVAEMESEGGIYAVNAQLLINPTPVGSARFNPDDLIEIEEDKIPKDILVIMTVDPAGDDKNGKGDSWSILTIGINVGTGQKGGNDIYIMDALISPLKESEAPHEIARMYLAAGVVQKIGVEKVGQSTTELHVKNALSERGRRISVDDGTLVILRPGGLANALRIERYLSPLLKGKKVYISKSVPHIYRERLRQEMSKFPFWHDDGLTALAYACQMMMDMDLSAYSNMGQYHYPPKKYVQATVAG